MREIHRLKDLIMIIIGILILFLTADVSVAAEQKVQYTYDSLGRVKTATYPNECIFTYVYDKNGNILEIKRENIKVTTSEEVTESKTEKNETTTEKPKQEITTEMVTDNNNNNNESDVTISVMHPSSKDIKAYNKFKKRKPVIKSISKDKKKGKSYITVKIKKLSNVGKYPETGYQIRYATNKKFKNAKSITIKKKRKSSITSKKWKAKKKTYYVKVRAYMITKTGKKIYSKYSKVKKL